MADTRLRALRADIDAINLSLLDLLNRRLALVEAVRREKAATGRALFDPQREAEEFDQLLLANRGPMTADQVKALYKEIFKLSLGHMQTERRRELRVHRAPGGPDSVYTIRGHTLGGQPVLVAGPCSVETEEQMEVVTAHLAGLGVRFLRGGAFKPRTSPYSFQGLGRRGLELLRAAADRHGMAVVSEILDPRDLDACLEHVDVLQVGTRNMYNYELLRLIGQTDRPVVIKRGFMATLEEFVLAAEYVAKEGNERIVLVERGIRTHERWTRNTIDLAAVPLLRAQTPFPVLVDVAHGTGRRDLLVPMAKAALAVGANGVMVEVHPNPALALSDNEQQLDLAGASAFVDAVFGGRLA